MWKHYFWTGEKCGDLNLWSDAGINSQNSNLIKFVEDRATVDNFKFLNFLRENLDIHFVNILKIDLDVPMLISGYWYQKHAKIVEWKTCYTNGRNSLLLYIKISSNHTWFMVLTVVNVRYFFHWTQYISTKKQLLRVMSTRNRLWGYLVLARRADRHYSWHWQTTDTRLCFIWLLLPPKNPKLPAINQ